jgi:hypothetical protein
VRKLEDYINFLQGKGFKFHEDALGFIQFGKQYANASDEQAIAAIELTLKAQKQFEGSFYISLLETLTANKIETRKDAFLFVKKNELLAI